MGNQNFTMASSNARADPDVRAKLLSHFKDVSGADQGEGWAKLWDAGDFLPWDRGMPNPALEDTLKGQTDLLGFAWTNDADDERPRRRKRALVPGCGRGYDVSIVVILAVTHQV